MAVAEAMAGRVELVSVDSMAVYRGMDIGTAKPSPADRAQVPYHLVDVVDACCDFTVQEFQVLARRAMNGIAERGRSTLLVGGTGLHLRSVVDDLTFPSRYPEVAMGITTELDAAGPEGSDDERAAVARLHDRLVTLDPVAAGRIEPTNRRRLVRAMEVVKGSGRPFSSFGPGLEAYPPTPVRLVAVRLPTEEIDQRIELRVTAMMEDGLLEEVDGLRKAPGGLSPTARQAVGYRELLAHLEDGLPLDRSVAAMVQRTRVLVRRQRAWFGRDPRIVWVTPEDDPVGKIIDLLGDPVGE